MTKLILIRHGEPDYSLVKERNFKGHGMDLAQLTSEGIEQAINVAKDKRLQGASIIVSSPYTRALQTAAIISKERSLDISIEVDIHEWVPDLEFNNMSDEEVKTAIDECIRCEGEYTNGETKKWEKLSVVASRAFKCLEKYSSYEKIIVVTHGMVMGQFYYDTDVPYCGIIEVNFCKDFKGCGWVKNAD
ncbi:histidine phosphatase family protein [Clostridium sp.]|uniref:histidine phosphatase family protein n=1 Tax=Clostridium sp. TaxID=1506 RepID=UPI003D6D454F